ncbi:hypothetical protein FHR93_003801 [Geodermatophilus sabuli]|nr:hypothetical protein [Geodermatophilus sabuli]
MTAVIFDAIESHAKRSFQDELGAPAPSSAVTCGQRLRDRTDAGVWAALHVHLPAEPRGADALDLDRCAVDGSPRESPAAASSTAPAWAAAAGSSNAASPGGTPSSDSASATSSVLTSTSAFYHWPAP